MQQQNDAHQNYLPTQGEARSRQTAYLATEHWWRSRVEARAGEWRERAAQNRQRAAVCGADDWRVEQALLAEAYGLESSAASLDALIAERNPR